MRRSNLLAADGQTGEGLTLAVDRPSTAALRLEVAAGGRLLVRQGDQVVLLGQVDPKRWGVEVCRTGRYRSVLPPLRADHARRIPEPGTPAWFGRWAHQFTTWLGETESAGPLHAGRWLVTPYSPPGSRDQECPWLSLWWRWALVRDDPGGYIDWDGNGWGGVLPLRRLPASDAGRVKAYRKQAREGVLAPVLLWWVSGLDGHLLVDGHERLAAALAEECDPPMLVLARGLDADEEQYRLEQVELGHATRMEHLQRQVGAGSPGARQAVDAQRQRFTRACAEIPRDYGRTRAWPVPGGAHIWEQTAALEAPDWRSGATRQ